MTQKVVLLDLENNVPTAKLLREIVEHYPTLYLFHCQGQFEYALQDLTELAAWISSGQVVILDTPKAEQKGIHQKTQRTQRQLRLRLSLPEATLGQGLWH